MMKLGCTPLHLDLHNTDSHTERKVLLQVNITTRSQNIPVSKNGMRHKVNIKLITLTRISMETSIKGTPMESQTTKVKQKLIGKQKNSLQNLKGNKEITSSDSVNLKNNGAEDPVIQEGMGIRMNK